MCVRILPVTLSPFTGISPSPIRRSKALTPPESRSSANSRFTVLDQAVEFIIKVENDEVSAKRDNDLRGIVVLEVEEI